MIVGYERVSTVGQSTLRQDALLSGKVEKLYSEKISGKDANRPELKAMMDFVREGDTVMVESISRLTRNTRDFLNILDEMEKKKVHFVSLKENIDTTTPTGRFMVHIFASLAELEREQILTRQREGIEAAKEAGTYNPGRPKASVDEKKLRAVCKDWRAGKMTAVEAMHRVELTKATFYRKVKEMGL